MPEDESALVARSVSVSTHRSQSSRWDPPEADGIGDYAAIMIAKVLRSKYPPASGSKIFELPIKRAFHHLDWTNRGWVPRDEVEQQCLAGASKLDWNLELSALARTVRMKDDNESSNPNHRVDLQEFINIVLTVREIATTNVSIKNGLRNAASALNAWYASSDGKKMLSGRWSRQHQYKPNPLVAERFWHKRPDNKFITYTHEFSGDIPETSAPLDPNITNAVYLATKYCLPQLNTAFASWRVGLRKWAAEERDEVIDALNNALEVAAKFHDLETNQDLDTFHWLDQLAETASIVLLSLYEDMGASPLESIRSMRTPCWSLLRQIIGFVNDLWIPQCQKDSLTIPDIQIWRKLRMLERSRTISKMASIFTDTSSVLKATQTWYSQHESLNIYGEECVRYARLLQQEQEKNVGSCEIHIDDVKLGRIPHIPFRKASPTRHSCVLPNLSKGAPSTFFKVLVDGDLREKSSIEFKTSSPVWTFDSNKTL